MIEIHSILDAERVLGGVEAAVFDLDDTLYPEKAYVRSGYAAVAALFPQCHDLAAQLWAAFEKGLPAIDVVLDANGLGSHKESALRAYRHQKPEIALYPGVREMLGRLCAIKKLGLITDGRPEGQRAKLRALSLEGLFDAILITDELGGIAFRKPNETAFVRMQRLLDVPFEEMAYVGDNIAKDFIAPEKLGMRCVWFRNPDGLYYEERK